MVWKGEQISPLGPSTQTKIPRKPVSQGAEIKTIADAQSGVILGLGLVERKERERQKQYASEFREGTAGVLRLSQPFQGTRRAFVADSAFACQDTSPAGTSRPVLDRAGEDSLRWILKKQHFLSGLADLMTRRLSSNGKRYTIQLKNVCNVLV
ncbi:TPA: hypothetical protein N0F65_005153 [Lagenidium giganteum]|uniref:PiggyBac transposable element-derived protein domain-containing protein n=1 Tax=Lagenidium giganteum TaxID=4803 RepID=A0AAV2YV39_9STRA|nr:TPA: hypothetical protein N0F65_005153 [Lagenidium giganteum]